MIKKVNKLIRKNKTSKKSFRKKRTKKSRKTRRKTKSRTKKLKKTGGNSIVKKCCGIKESQNNNSSQVGQNNSSSSLLSRRSSNTSQVGQNNTTSSSRQNSNRLINLPKPDKDYQQCRCLPKKLYEYRADKKHCYVSEVLEDPFLLKLRCNGFNLKKGKIGTRHYRECDRQRDSEILGENYSEICNDVPILI